MGTLCLSGSAIAKAGAGVSTALTTQVEDWIKQAEGTIGTVSRFDWVANWGTLSGSNVAGLIEGTCSDLAGINAVAFDMTGYTSRIEAEDIITVLRDSALRGLSIIRDQKAVDFINAT